ncbi:CPBP family intramembrane metalloprotease [Nocardia gipuzkoensis]|uniref:CPBP family intramembrane glutamic endopeptidase n=1 Tax=Nocardia gipuzkoensis TaxID=2749991 RepID=UPI001E5F8A48|nr:CPBP family intramembrane glutamic endopeptidase [Nocardia gipuzkoensis]UGT66642.1 CPBP family intramembrane metalloprotease [Nocardia gipuzkoensis]
MRALEDTRPNRVVQQLLSDRHCLPLSVALHLVPGVLIVAAYLLIGEPFVKAIGYPVLMGWAIALCLVLIPILVGLLWLGHKRNGHISLRGVLHYTDKPVPRGKLVVMVIPLIVWMTVLSFATTPMNRFFLENFFTWVPYTDGAGSATAFLDGYSYSIMLTTMVICLPLTGISLPLIEELYFRGFLLPRIAHLGGWAPLVSTVLFSLYHFWSPWVFVSRVIFMFPGFWFAWQNKDIRLSIGMHVGVTSIVATFGTIAVALNVI